MDFLKIRVRDQDLINELNHNENLVWHDRIESLSHFDFETIQSKETKTFNGVLFCFTPGKLEILLRPHYYYNDNLHNANRFTSSDCIKTLIELLENLNIRDLEKFKIINIEFGVNLISPIKIEDLITFITYYNRSEFRTDDGLLYSKKCYSVSKNGNASKYKILKAYAKGIQFPNYTDKNTFRFEIKSKESKYIRKLGIQNIGDLLNSECYEILGNELIENMQYLLILDNNACLENLCGNDKKRLENLLNSHTWYKALQKSRNTFNNTRKRYFNLLDKTGFNIHSELINLLNKELQLLNNCADSEPQQIIEDCAYSEPSKFIEGCADSELYIGGISTNSINALKRICPITNVDISMQKDGSILLSNTGLKYYEKKKPEIFQFIKDQLLTGNPNKFEKDIYSKISKQIRNKYFNNPGAYAKEQGCLFN